MLLSKEFILIFIVNNKIYVKKGGLYMFVYDILEKKKLDLKILILNYRKEKK